MVERYALAPMKLIWTQKASLERWLNVELAVVRAYEQLGIAPAGTYERALANSLIDESLFHEYEARTDHDLIAFVKMATKNMKDEARFFHYGLTSSDIVDTSLSLALKEASTILLNELEKLLKSLWNLANEHKNTIIIGRTHGVHAEPTTFGLKVLSWFAEMKRNKERLLRAKEEVSFGKISGAVGNYANVSPEVEVRALSYLGLKPTPVSSQIISRDHHAAFLMTLSLIASSIEKIATEIRHLQRTEVLEVEEPFKIGQKGSSAMPHKKNPILCERLCGLSRMIRAFVVPSLENNVLWHERDISHSSVERFVFPDATQILHYMLVKTSYLINNLVVHEEKMLENVHLTKGLIFSQRLLLKLVETGLSRNEAYDIVQSMAMECWNNHKDLRELCKERLSFSEDDLKQLFDVSYYLKHVNSIFDRFRGE